MRSVFVHLWHTTEGEVTAELHRAYPASGGSWTLATDGDPSLYIELYRDGPAEDDRWHARFASRGGPPDVSVVADISGRLDGWPEARQFVHRLLSAFDGIATDDAWLHLWSKDEVENDRVVSGRRFGHWRNNRDRPAAGEQ